MIKLEKNEMVFGIRAIIEAMEAGQSIDKIFLKNDTTGELSKELIDIARSNGVPIHRVPLEKLNRLTRKNHQGVIALISPVPYYDIEEIIARVYEEGRVPTIVVLDGITDTRNFGAIARTADCSGVDALLIPDRGSVSITPEAIKTSAGALFHIPICRCRNLLDTIRIVKASGIRLIGTSEKASYDYTNAAYTEPVALVMGAEDTGISKNILRECDELVSIPIKGNISSLNVSVAAGVMMYEVLRQRSLHIR